MTTFQEKLLDVLKFTTSFLESHNLKYVACGGTVLGAARHKGIIPWDDDIDIYMWREDYNKLFSLKEEAKSKGFDILSVYTDENYYCPFAKVVDLSTTIWEFKEFPFVLGAFVDIFPLDSYDWDDSKILNMKKKGRRLFNLYKASISNENFFSSFSYIKEKNFGAAARSFCKPFCSNQKIALERFLKFEKTYIGMEGEKCGSGYQWGKTNFKTEWLKETIEVPFEDTTILIPKEYDAYLTAGYGDWRKLPPKEKQVSIHSHYYLNFNEHLTIDEIKERLQNGERFVM